MRFRARSYAMLAILAFGPPPGLLHGQEAERDDEVEAVSAVTAGEQRDGDLYARADSIRDSFERPPSTHPADWVDVVEFPLKLIGYPLDLLLVRFPGWIAANLTAPRPPNFLTRTYRDMTAWGLRPAIRSTIGPRSAAAVELQLDRYRPFYFHTAVSRRLSQRHRAGLLLGDDRHWLVSEAKWQRDSELPWYGVGSATSKADRAFYRRDWLDVALRAGLAVTPTLALNAGVGYEANTVGDPILASRSLFEFFDPAALYGAQQRTEYVRFEALGTLDLTRWRGFQQRGITLGFAGLVYRGIGSTDSDFHVLTGFAQAYAPVNRQQTLAVRVVSDVTRSDGGEGIPFFHLASLGGSRTNLGYPSNRFRDNDLLALMSEWRYEVWRELHSRARAELFLFFHHGAVVRRLGDVFDDAGSWNASYGLGMRIAERERLLGLAYLGFNPKGEGITAGIRGSWPF